MNTSLVLAVAAGGAIGSVGRYLAVAAIGRLAGTDFPWGTLAVNVLGGLAIGIVAEFLAQRWQGGPELRAFLVVGVLGGFTTFSAFSLEMVALLERGAWGAAIAYALCSVGLSLLGTFAGIAAFRALA